MGTLVRDSIFWVLTSLSMLAAFYFQYVNVQQLPIQASMWLLSVFFVLLSLRLTSSGKEFIRYLKLSKVEIKKVVWPSKNEVVVTTFVVGLAVALIAFMITVLDSVLVRVLSAITG